VIAQRTSITTTQWLRQNRIPLYPPRPMTLSVPWIAALRANSVAGPQFQ
jgi:hypothetical protein